jgi:hypothetical protein
MERTFTAPKEPPPPDHGRIENAGVRQGDNVGVNAVGIAFGTAGRLAN